ncbi:hypothetical protein ABB37_06013 [Leptomonas pyrrhocoris]|uniref:RRM domain-containing protein n=1 Tax=Leptomonas pyrrhocoris TaxID=157538 RepID=A0A0M9FZ80_LEPPY|nr:hypothetical protein ABB37_06013 [Leptomonas pyrrhocoris]KPA78949.1 hypothetical protein ABB37_06013 [Leptomonas pyrrhocoris]|eukprot:XP_015657388.1 hypothetical protein ABB37_06013 [Leptomonas pyrrhocoris]
MASTDKPTRLPSPPGSGTKASSDDTASPNGPNGPFAPSSGFTAPLFASPFTTSYSPFHTVSTMSGASSHASVKQQSRAEVVARTVHLRCLPPFMKQKDLADVFDECGEYLRVRICGNSATHQKWVYGFVEFTTKEAAAAMLTHSGMELANGAGKPPLRLKCSPSKQPILDCMAYDADVITGTPCGFGRGYLAECSLNDALLVVGSGGAAAGGGGASLSGSVNNGAPAGDGRGRTSAANRALTALTVSSIRKVAATGCGCGCAGVNCCGCCQCWKGEKTQKADSGGTPVKDSGGAGGGCCDCDGGGSGGIAHTQATATTRDKSDDAGLTTATSNVAGGDGDTQSHTAAPAPTSDIFAELSKLPSTVNAAELDVLQQLAAAFQGLRATATSAEGPLDGPGIVRKAETMALDALSRASHLSSDTRLQDIRYDLTQLLAFLDANAAVTGGAAQTASGDCTATLPQRVTQLRLLANLVGALLCLLRRSVADAVPYVEAVLVTFAQIPPSSLLLRARQHEKGVGAARGAPAAAADAAAGPVLNVAAPRHNGAGGRPLHNVPSLPPNESVDEGFAEEVLNLIDEDDEQDGVEKQCTAAGSGNVDAAAAHSSDGKAASTDEEEQFLLNGSRSLSSCSDESTAFLNSADMADLCRRDETFTRYVLNAVVSVGIAMESVQPMIARSAYTLANARAVEVLGEPSAMVAACLAASPTAPRLCEMLFHDAAATGKLRDITFFPHRFFESVNATRQRVRETRGTECFWRQLPPNHVAPLFNF